MDIFFCRVLCTLRHPQKCLSDGFMWTTHRFSPVLLNVMHRYFYLLRKYSGSPNNLVYAILKAESGSQHEEKRVSETDTT